MPPPALLDPTQLDFNDLLADAAAIQRFNPQRHEFAMLDGVLSCADDGSTFVGYHDVRADDWWVRGHIPGRPLFPGVLMIEVAAQLASFVTHHLIKDCGFIGFAGVDKVKFRGTVEPPCRFVVIGRATEVRKRRTVCETQGYVGSTMVFEAVITGMAI